MTRLGRYTSKACFRGQRVAAAWEPIWPSDDLTRAGFRRRLRRYAEDVAADRSYPFIIFRESDGVMIGGITLANVRRGIVQAGTIGYWVGQPHAHRGYMRPNTKRYCG